MRHDQHPRGAHNTTSDRWRLFPPIRHSDSDIQYLRCYPMSMVARMSFRTQTFNLSASLCVAGRGLPEEEVWLSDTASDVDADIEAGSAPSGGGGGGGGGGDLGDLK